MTEIGNVPMKKPSTQMTLHYLGRFVPHSLGFVLGYFHAG